MAHWDEADHFRLPLIDGSFGTGQVVSRVWEDCALVLLTARRTPKVEAPLLSIELSEVISLIKVDPAGLVSGLWPIVDYDALPGPAERFSVTSAPETCFDAPIVEAYLNAFHGLIDWDGFAGKGFFDAMLFPGTQRPTTNAARLG